MTPREWVGREKKEPDADDARIYDSFYAFSNRFNVVREPLKDWYPHVVRGEALFGVEAKRVTEALAKVVNKLWIAIEMWHQNEIKSRGRDEGQTSLYNIMYGIDPAENPGIPEESRRDSDFHAEFRAAMSGIEQVFRPHVKR